MNLNNVEDQLDATITIYWYSNQLNMFRAIFAHPQERKAVFAACGIMHPICCRPVVWNAKAFKCLRVPDQWCTVKQTSNMNLIHTFIAYLKFVLMWFSHLRINLPSNLFPSLLPVINLCTSFIFFLRARRSAAVILLDFYTLTVSGEYYAMQSLLTIALTWRDSSFALPRM